MSLIYVAVVHAGAAVLNVYSVPDARPNRKPTGMQQKSDVAKHPKAKTCNKCTAHPDQVQQRALRTHVRSCSGCAVHVGVCCTCFRMFLQVGVLQCRVLRCGRFAVRPGSVGDVEVNTGRTQADFIYLELRMPSIPSCAGVNPPKL